MKLSKAGEKVIYLDEFQIQFDLKRYLVKEKKLPQKLYTCWTDKKYKND
jgi:hypothetical protein